jgi:transcriptional regulator with XRE-family HTH domain
MSITNIKNKLKKTSIKDTTWIESAKFRKENENWLEISFAIAVKMFSVLKENKKNDIFPRNQKELAIVLDCTPQYVNKLLKGAEKLNIETIVKIQKALKITIINKSFHNKKVEIVAQQDKVFTTPKRTAAKNYKKLNGVIHYNFTTSRSGSNQNVYIA